jgi:TonB-dependent SusC/RagA subfamily outer membrane receptor
MLVFRHKVAVGLLLGLMPACAWLRQDIRPAAEPAADSAAARQDRGSPPGTITAEDIRRARPESIKELLEGRIPGVTVIRTASGLAIRIRGYSSFYGSNEPLYVVDGVPLSPGPGGSVLGIAPYDIESIRVLKEPVDLALYGIRGANGVVVITTVRPGR